MTDVRSEFEVARQKVGDLKKRHEDLVRQRDEIQGRMTELTLEMGDLMIEALNKGREAGVFNSPAARETLQRAIDRNFP